MRSSTLDDDSIYLRNDLRKFLRVLLGIFVVLLAAVPASGGLCPPFATGGRNHRLNGLHAEVSVERDRWGIPHIRAGSLEDMVERKGT